MKTTLPSQNTAGPSTHLLAAFLFFCAGACLAQTPSATGTTQAATTDYVCVQRGPNAKVWQKSLFFTNAAGDVTTNSQSYTELATGISYLVNGQYVDSVEEVDPVPGGAQAVQGRYQVQWALNANTPGGAVTVATADGKQLSSTVFGLAYYDSATGSNVAIGGLKNCTGAIVAPNQVLYTNAFSNVTADLLYTYTKAGLSQDVVLDQSPPAPDTYGLSDATTVLEVWTAFINTPQPAITAVTNGNVADDQVLDFGDMKMGVGQALFLDGQDAPLTEGAVAKQWVQINNATYLIESIPYSSISNQLQQLPHASNLKPNRASIRHLAFLDPNPAPPNGPAKATTPMQLAKLETGKPRLKVDYELLSSSASLTLQGDTTYFVTCAVIITGTTTIEGGTVVKYTNSASAGITTANIVCLTGPYSPGVFTSMNDNSVGSIISGSTGVPSQGDGDYLYDNSLGPNSLALRNLHFSYAYEGISATVNSIGTNSLTIWDCQFVDCAYGSFTTIPGGIRGTLPLYAYNVLFSGCTTAALGETGGAHGFLAITAVNVTADQVGAFQTGATSCQATNCIFTSVTNLTGVSAVNCPTYGSSSGMYQSVGAGGYYLANGSTNRGVGSSNIPTNLLADLQTLTTIAPVVTNGWITNSCTLSQQVARNTGVPDLGFHYSPIDYALNVELSNATVTVLPGTVLAGYGSNGVYLYTNATFNCQGTATSPVCFVRYNTAQEQSNTNWESTNWNALLVAPAGPDSSLGRFAFSDWSVMAGDTLYSSTLGDGPLWLQNCQLWDGVITLYGTGFFSTNCLYGRVFLDLLNHTTSAGVNATNTLCNNLFWRGTIDCADNIHPPIWTFRDNLFDECTNEVLTYPTNVISSNAYVTTNFGVLSPTNGQVILSNSPAYQTGALGDYYYPANLTNLIHQGSQLASSAGLYFYTVLTNANSMEGTNTVSIGFHYVATDGYGVPLGGEDGGVPDYLQDPTGNGVLNPFLIFDQAQFPNEPETRLGYWKFNTWALTNEAGQGPPIYSNNLSLISDWSGTAVSLTHTDASSQLIYPVTANGVNYFNPANGTIRFWYQPNWSTTNSSSLVNPVVFLEANSASGYWGLAMPNSTNQTGLMEFNTENGANQRNYSFVTGAFNGALIQFQANLWYQIVLTYSPSNVAVYTNGILLATATSPPDVAATLNSIFEVGSGNVYYPPLSQLYPGFSFGNSSNQAAAVLGQLDELETFNYPLTAQQVAWGYPYFGGNPTNMVDTYYVGRSDMLQTYVDGIPPSSTNANVVQSRLGYWRFDSPLLYSEQGEMPLSTNNVSLTPSWSGTALNIGSAADSEVTYPDVGSNGWANINCRQGSVRFWFKPGTSSPETPAPFVYMGSPDGSNEWNLEWAAAGTTIEFVTRTNQASPVTILSASASCLSTSKWTQIVLTYGSNSCTLYTNGVLAASGPGNTNWPSVANRQLGMVIGNTTAYDTSIDGQFEEMETFNYQLAPSNILANFQTVASVDSDLDGIPDLLEDIYLPAGARPFLGQPVVITGTIEAEQFDMGSNTVGYSTTNTALNTVYRPTKMIISPCTDLGGGYCLDQMHSNDWTQYTINVLVPQTYMVDVRAESVGTATGGMFECTFTNAGFTNVAGFSNSTPPLAIPSTNWTDITNVVYLPNGTNVMKLHCLTNDSSGTVGRFNYISIYPWWPPPTNGPGSEPVLINTAPTNAPNGLFTGSNYLSASNNAYWIQKAVDSLPANGGTVTIPTGTWYVSQAYPNDANDACSNAAVAILDNNIQIAGEGTSSTFVIANNRATTVFCLGQRTLGGQTVQAQVTNFTLTGLTIQANPHEAPTNSGSGYINIYELGQLQVTNSQAQGSIAVFYGKTLSQFSYNILISNCVFLHGIKSMFPYDEISNFMVVNCQFVPDDATCLFTGQVNGPPNNTNAPTEHTTTWQGADVGIFGDGPYNAVIVSNIYIGNSDWTNMNTNAFSFDPAPDGFVWFQNSGNVFVARNIISNNALEAVQLNAGPNSVVGNTFGTLVSDGSCCALCLVNGWPTAMGATGGNVLNYSTSFIGNWVSGVRHGVENLSSTNGTYSYNCSGNYFQLAPAFDVNNDYPSIVAEAAGCLSANVCGNTVVSNGLGFWFTGTNNSALILNNNFSNATYRGIGHQWTGDSLNTAQIFSNILGDGVSYHVQLTYTNSFGWFLGNNKYVTTNGTEIPLFTDPASSSIHISN